MVVHYLCNHMTYRASIPILDSKITIAHYYYESKTIMEADFLQTMLISLSQTFLNVNGFLN